jgi:hypothetical protein
MIKKVKAVASRTKKVATRARPKSRPAMARVTRTARKVVKRARKGRQPRPEDRETGRGAPEALAGPRLPSPRVIAPCSIEQPQVPVGRRLIR